MPRRLSRHPWDNKKPIDVSHTLTVTLVTFTRDVNIADIVGL
jgi:hypothetical protein